MTQNEIVKFLLDGGDIEFAEVFVKYWKVLHINGGLAEVDEVDELNADDMNNFDLEGFTKHIHDVLNEVIFSEEIESSAWWKHNED